MTSIASLQLPPLRKKSMAQLVAKAKNLGIAPENYARQLIEDGLALQREAESTTIAEIMRPVRQSSGIVDETEIINLVEMARTDNRHKAARRGKKG